MARAISSVHVDIAELLLLVLKTPERERGKWITSLAEALASRDGSAHTYAAKLLTEGEEYRRADRERKKAKFSPEKAIPAESTESGDAARNPATEIQKYRNTEIQKEGTQSAGADHDFLKSAFDEARKAYPGTKRGLEPEWDNFRKKYPKQVSQIVPLLLPAIREGVVFREDCAKLKAFCPDWKNFKTWINGSHWLDEFPDKIEVPNGR